MEFPEFPRARWARAKKWKSGRARARPQPAQKFDIPELYPNISKVKNKISSHSIDYENYLSLKKKMPSNVEPYVVFIDVNIKT